MRWVLLGLFLLLPLQWFGLGSTPLGQARLHQVAIVVVALVVYARFPASAYAPVLRAAAPFVALMVFMLLAWAAVDVYNGLVPTGSVQELLYLAVFVALATCFFRAADGRHRELASALRWVAPVAAVSVVVGFTLAMLVNGVNPGLVLSKTIASADPEILQKEIFKSSFAGFGLEDDLVRGNLRHEIFGSVLLSMMISTWAMRFGDQVTRAQRLAYRAAMLVGALLLALSLSRSVLIAALVWPLLSLSRSVRLGGLSPRQVAAAGIAVVGLAVFMASGIGVVILNRFTTDTTGYDARLENYAGVGPALADHWLTGGYQIAGLHVSSHNFIIDSWLRGGLFTMLPAVGVVAVIGLTFALLATRLPRLPEWMVPVTAALALPLVRFGTAGGGMIPPVEWVALGFALGVIAYQQHSTQAQVDVARRLAPVTAK